MAVLSLPLDKVASYDMANALESGALMGAMRVLAESDHFSDSGKIITRKAYAFKAVQEVEAFRNRNEKGE